MRGPYFPENNQGRLRVRFEDSKDDSSYDSRTGLNNYNPNGGPDSRFMPLDIVSPVSQPMETPATKQSPIPKVISILELYKSYLELSLTVGSSIMFIFLHILMNDGAPSGVSTKLTIFVDLALVPWLIWITKKIVDTVKAYKLRVSECEVKYEEKLKELTERESNLRMHFRQANEGFEVNHQNIDISMPE
jgi:hypothetical protein